ncbi:helix-turn-helix domain-containing protein [Streptomyces sp. NPDC088197]|uniref:helix-turn-helix domain-containing protein n=1 Tax=Streptomyces sp. NPDC088197 TaxID=3365840 RepID=UPI0037F1AD99
MGRPQKELPPDGSPVTLFAFWLRDLRRTAGLTFDQLSRHTGYGRTTMTDALRGDSHPTLPVTMAIVGACGGDIDKWGAFWAEVHRALDKDAVPGTVIVSPPPWTPSIAGGAHGELCPSGCARTDPHGWYTESVETRLRLDTVTPEAVERRVIVATCDGLAEIPVAFSVPRRTDDEADGHGLEVSVLDGGRLDLPEHPYESFFQQRLILPTPLRTGARHTYTLRLRIPQNQPMAPHFVHVPLTRSERFSLRVRFAPGRPPLSVWQLSRVPTAVIYQRAPGTSLLRPDRQGTVAVEFDAMRVGYGYGLCWQDGPAPAAPEPDPEVPPGY